MKIFVDARHLEGNVRGIGFFLQSILKELSKIDSENIYILLVRKNINFKEFELGKNFILYQSNFPFGIADFISIPYRVNKKIKPDLVWFPANNCSPFINKKIKVISTIHDILYFHLKYKLFTKQWFGSRYRRIFSKIAVKRADLIHTITKYNVDIISRKFNLDESKFFYTYHGINISKGNDDSIFHKLKLNDHNYIYTISGTSPNKNLTNIIKAFRKFEILENKKFKLVITGVANSADYIKKNNLNVDNVIFTGYITNEQKNSLLKKCELFLFLSRAEGFGMPPAEAIYHNCNILMSDIPTLKEIYLGFGNFTSTEDTNLIAKDIKLTIKNHVRYDNGEILNKLNWNFAATTLFEKMIQLNLQNNQDL